MLKSFRIFLKTTKRRESETCQMKLCQPDAGFKDAGFKIQG